MTIPLQTLVIDTSPEVVFKAITDPNELTNWFPDNAIFDGRIGGKVRFTFNKERSEDLNSDHSPEGTVKEFIPNKKASYTWQLKDTSEFPDSTVTWELEEIDAIKTSETSSFRLYR
ncbi:MAG: SRPBCC domain-containing protein [Thermoproteota archaeon]|nr:SRPBCC domain-containing protein [Thermoproteota archaeon]